MVVEVFAAVVVEDYLVAADLVAVADWVVVVGHRIGVVGTVAAVVVVLMAVDQIEEDEVGVGLVEGQFFVVD